MAARSAAPNGLPLGRARRRSAGSRPGPGPSVPGSGSARRRGGPGSTTPPPPSRRSPDARALVVELGEVGGQGRVLERPAVEPGGAAAERRGVERVTAHSGRVGLAAGRSRPAGLS